MRIRKYIAHRLSSSSLSGVVVFMAGALSLVSPLAARAQVYFAGTQITLSSDFSYPAGVAVDANGNVYVADSKGGTVEELVAVNGSIPADSTPVALNTGSVQPTGVALDASGDLLIVDLTRDHATEVLAVNGSIPANPRIL